jgi:hypothetical protein
MAWTPETIDALRKDMHDERAIMRMIRDQLHELRDHNLTQTRLTTNELLMSIRDALNRRI